MDVRLPAKLFAWKRRKTLTNPEAARASLAKWEALYEAAKERGFDVDAVALVGDYAYSEACALCAIHVDADRGCRGCPLSNVGGYCNSDDSPWMEATDKPSAKTIRRMISALKRAVKWAEKNDPTTRYRVVVEG